MGKLINISIDYDVFVFQGGADPFENTVQVKNPPPHHGKFKLKKFSC